MARLSEPTLFKKLTELGHSHYCSDRSCRIPYDCIDVRAHMCNPRVNGPCPECRGRDRTIWTQSHLPRLCCTNNVTQVTDRDVLLAFRLAGPGPWFKCKKCARTGGWPRGFNSTTEGARHD